MPAALALFLSLFLAQPAAGPVPDGLSARLGPSARVSRDATRGHVRQISAARLPLPSGTLAGLVEGFFAPLRAELGVEPSELVEVKREAWDGGTAVTLQRKVDGHEVVDGGLRVTLAPDGSLSAYAAGDVAPVTRSTRPTVDEAAARAAARQVLPGLVGEGAADLVYLGGRLAWRLRYAPTPAAVTGSARAPSLTYAPIVFVDAASGELLALRNGLVP